MKADSRMAEFSGRVCLVTGGAGGIGSNLVRMLIQSGAQVVVLDDLSSGRMENLIPFGAQIRIIRGSVTSAVDLQAAFATEPNYVFHLAAHFANQNSIEHPFADMITNAVGTQMLLDFARRNRNLKGLVYASSSCVLGNQSGTMTEETHPMPETPYGVSKLAGEHYTLVYAAVYGLPATVVRYFNVYGPGEFPGEYRNVIPNFMHRAIHGQDLPITGTGEETREFVFVEDAVRGTMQAAITAGGRGQVFHLGSGCVLTIRELAEKIVALSGGRSQIEYYPRRSWDGVSTRQTLMERARTVLHYEPRVQFDEGILATWKWLTAQELELGCTVPHKFRVAAAASGYPAAAMGHAD